MKRFLLILMTVILLFSSCKKEEVIKPVEPTPVTYQIYSINIECSHYHTMMYSYINLNDNRTDIPIYSKTFEKKIMLKPGTKIKIHTRIDNFSAIPYITVKVFRNGIIDTTYTRDFVEPIKDYEVNLISK